MSGDNVMPIRPPSNRRNVSVEEIRTTVIRAREIVRAVRTAGDHENGDYLNALEQVEDMLDEVDEPLSILEDAAGREGKS